MRTTAKFFGTGYNLDTTLEDVAAFQREGGWEIRQIMPVNRSGGTLIGLIVVFESPSDAEFELIRQQLIKEVS